MDRLWLRSVVVAWVLAGGVALTSGPRAQWVEFDEQTALRSDVALELFADDLEEKDYAWGDLDRDGDLDLAVVRKEPFMAPGKRVNVLLMNQGGVLTDRTADFAVDADVPGDQGFLTPTTDRDVVLVDVDQDGWLDLITATAISEDGDLKHIAYPRVYMNRCCVSGGCAAESCATEDWLGLRFEDARMPLMLTDDGQSGVHPCFCAVSHGDLTGDGFPDLYFSDYDTECPEGDFNDKLLINEGESNPGFFVDVTETNFIGDASGFPVSGFGASGGIGKFNQDEHNDILKEYASFVGLAYNTPSNLGVFEKDDNPYNGSAYFASYGDLNNDGMLDLVVSDDGSDRFFLNQGDDGDGIAQFLSFIFAFSHSGAGQPASDEGFSGNNLVADLDNDGHDDVVITDVDDDVISCSRRTHIYKNLGGPDGGERVLEEQTSGSNCSAIFNNPETCIVTTIPASDLKGTHDVAVFDINGDGWKDMVVGRCFGTEVYVNLPPFGVAGSTPDGDLVEGAVLTVGRDGDQITLSWGESCLLDDDDYSVYHGDIDGGFEDHVPLLCSTGGLTSVSFPDEGESKYYLVAPRNLAYTGSLGASSLSLKRPIGPEPCTPQLVGDCQ